MRACASVCLRPTQTSSTAPITNTARTAQCDGPYAVNSRCVSGPRPQPYDGTAGSGRPAVSRSVSTVTSETTAATMT